MVDFATLTGAARVALGTELPALFCNDETFAEQVLAAGTVAEDPLWRLPLWPGYRKMIEGKRVVLVDDSIVRGTTSQKIVQMVRDAGAKEVHMRIASPPTRASCFYGVDTPEKSKLLASRMSIREMADFIRVDSLGFLSIDGLYRAVGEANRDAEQPQFCDACFTGEYPTRLLDLEGTDNVRTLSLLATGGQ